MEVHHHPGEHTAGKKFWEYFLEFLMIFLAVTMGFLAESLREHIVEKKREKEYMKEIVENLKYDTLRCKLNAANNIIIASGLDSLRNGIKEAVLGKINGNEMYYFVLHYAGQLGRAVFNTSAITELKNSGSLRLIKNKKIVEEVADYYERKILAAESFRPTQDHVDALQKTITGFFSLLELDDYVQSFDNVRQNTYTNDYDYQLILQHTPALKLLKSDPEGLERLYTEVSQFEIKLKQYNFWLYFCKEAATKLITDIKKEYGIEKE
jgi:hypothetical protein